MPKFVNVPGILKLKTTMLALALFSVLPLSALAATIYTTGNPYDVQTSAESVVCLGGGGSDDQWAEGWRSMLKASDGGDVVIIRADGKRGGYESWIYEDEDSHQFTKVNSVRTIVLESREDTQRPDVAKLVLQAEMVFFAGGDQSKYINWIKGSRLAAALEYVVHTKKIPIGGTSAGMALLAGIDYRAQHPSPSDGESMVTSEDVLRSPTEIFVDLDSTVLSPPLMSTIITDTHFSERNRQGRLLGFMARAVYNRYPNVHATNIKGIGADEGTAVCYTPEGRALVYGVGRAYFLQGQTQIERIEPGTSLNWYGDRKAVSAYVIQGSNSNPSAGFDLTRWKGYGGVEQHWWVDGSNPHNPIFGMD